MEEYKGKGRLARNVQGTVSSYRLDYPSGGVDTYPKVCYVDE